MLLGRVRALVLLGAPMQEHDHDVIGALGPLHLVIGPHPRLEHVDDEGERSAVALHQGHPGVGRLDIIDRCLGGDHDEVGREQQRLDLLRVLLDRCRGVYSCCGTKSIEISKINGLRKYVP